MRDYIGINNYSGLGQIGISRDAIAAIASASVREVKGAALFERKGTRKAAKRADTSLGVLFSLPNDVRVVFRKDGRALIKMEVAVVRGNNVVEVCEKIQRAVATSVTLMCDTVPFDVQVKVMRIV
ncbi:MAG: Asp23/Gls24 family envelope stress response protein [Bacilli bacterium]|nr:Asp23/Gls24 family envelope stress response protein [Bacilli bacterium]